MTRFVPIAMFGWIPLVLLIFARFPPRRAALISFLAGWMFLPIAAYRFHGVPDYTKTLAVCGGIFLAILIFDFRGLLRVRPSLVDVPILLFCISPFVSSIAGGLGLHEAESVVFCQVVTWGIPWLAGVLYFKTLAELRELAIGIIVGGLIYVPLCIAEIIRGPRLHLWIYGFAQADISRNAMRFGGWRPNVFMNNGLAVALWMASASVLAIWIWKAGLRGPFQRLWPACLAGVLVATTVGLKSVNGWVLLALGAILLTSSSRLRRSVVVYLTLLLVLAYVVVGATGIWNRDPLVRTVRSVFGTDRAQSLQYRFQNEQVISRNARERPIFGWGRTAAVFEDRNHEILPFEDRRSTGYAVVDSLWIGIFAGFGILGLAGVIGSLLLPVGLWIRRFPPATWEEAKIAPAAALAVVLLLYAIDDVANGSVNPVFMLIAGGLAHCGLQGQRAAELR